MKFETLGDWCKWLEKNFSNDVMIPGLPVIIRLDGNNFSKWTKGLQKPFDSNLNRLMVETTKFLTKETNAVIGYTQSDEITLILYSSDRKSSIYNDGKKQKILSKLTSKCTLFFNKKRKELLPNHDKDAFFDCRIYQTPTLEDACAQLLWRELDATKNSISMLAQSLFSHKDLQGLHANEMQDKMLLEKGVNWNDIETRFKRGVYVKRVLKTGTLSEEELSNLPEKHHARTNPSFTFERSVIEEIDMPIFSKIINKKEVIFGNENPILFRYD